MTDKLPGVFWPKYEKPASEQWLRFRGQLKEDFSIPLNLDIQPGAMPPGVAQSEAEQYANRVYDNVHIFPFIGHGMLKIIGNRGLVQFLTSIPDALRVAEAAGITPVERPDITTTEYDIYKRFMKRKLQEEEIGELDFMFEYNSILDIEIPDQLD